MVRHRQVEQNHGWIALHGSLNGADRIAAIMETDVGLGSEQAAHLFPNQRLVVYQKNI